MTDNKINSYHFKCDNEDCPAYYSKVKACLWTIDRRFDIDLNDNKVCQRIKDQIVEINRLMDIPYVILATLADKLNEAGTIGFEIDSIFSCYDVTDSNIALVLKHSIENIEAGLDDNIMTLSHHFCKLFIKLSLEQRMLFMTMYDAADINDESFTDSYVRDYILEHPIDEVVKEFKAKYGDIDYGD